MPYSVFEKSKQLLSASTLLAHPLLLAQLRFSSDASDSGIRAVLEQRESGSGSAFSFSLRKMSLAEACYSTLDCELLTILKFQPLIESRHYLCPLITSLLRMLGLALAICSHLASRGIFLLFLSLCRICNGGLGLIMLSLTICRETHFFSSW